MKEKHIVIWLDDSNDLNIDHFRTREELEAWIAKGKYKCVGVSGQELLINDEMSC